MAKIQENIKFVIDNGQRIITEEWLTEIGFKWFDVERSGKHWILWIGDCLPSNPYHGRTNSRDDFGIELSKFNNDEDVWSIFYRADYAGRYTRFIYVRDVWTRAQLIGLIEAIIGIPFEKDNAMYGNLFSPQQMARIKAEEKHRIDRQMALERRWRSDEKDDSKAV